MATGPQAKKAERVMFLNRNRLQFCYLAIDMHLPECQYCILLNGPFSVNNQIL